MCSRIIQILNTYSPRDAVRSSEHVCGVHQGACAHVHVVCAIFLQDSGLPRVLSCWGGTDYCHVVFGIAFTTYILCNNKYNILKYFISHLKLVNDNVKQIYEDFKTISNGLVQGTLHSRAECLQSGVWLIYFFLSNFNISSVFRYPRYTFIIESIRTPLCSPRPWLFAEKWICKIVVDFQNGVLEKKVIIINNISENCNDFNIPRPTELGVSIQGVAIGTYSSRSRQLIASTACSSTSCWSSHCSSHNWSTYNSTMDVVYGCSGCGWVAAYAPRGTEAAANLV